MASTQSSKAVSNLTSHAPESASAPLEPQGNVAGEAAPSKTMAATKQPASGLSNAIDRVLNLLSSVPFGIVQLILLITACMIGMLIQQQELETFAGYYAELTPAEKTIYGRLGFFDIYHAWYFNLLLLLLSLNIILASIDHFPAAWSFIRRKKLTASPTFAMAQKFKEKIALPHLDRARLVERARHAARAQGFKVRVTEEATRTTVFAERGVWNRLGAYVVHIGLLTIFFGGFMTSRGFTGMLPVQPDQSADKMVKQVFNVDHNTGQHAIGTQELQLPFTVEGVDIQQKLIKPDGSLDAGNTLDWITRVRIVDHETGQKTDALIHMNSPFDYRGYRLFQASFNPLGSAREVKLRVTPKGGQPQEVTIKRNGETKLADGTRLKLVEFNPAVQFTAEGRIDIGATEYVNPAAHLLYITPDGKQGDAWAFNEAFIGQISGAPVLKQKFVDALPFSVVLTNFERVSLAHHLSVQFDPGTKIVYVGFTILCLTLLAVFFFAHQRLWIVVEDGQVHLGGDANRNRLAFEDRARKLARLIREPV